MTVSTESADMEKSAKNLVGIYQIRCTPSAGCFIGSSQSLHQALLKNMGALILGTHENSQLQQLWSQFGPSSCEFSIIEIVKDRYSLPRRLKFWLDEKNAFAISPSSLDDKACGHISIQKELRDEIRNLRSSTMLETVRFLVKFYNDHHIQS